LRWSETGSGPYLLLGMIDLVAEKRPNLFELCRRFGVQRLHVFGSAATGAFRKETSDLDFLVSFNDRRPTADYANRVLDFADALERLFARPVDLVTEQSVRNPYFRRALEASRQLIYERSDEEVAV
jgi:predicted nucleotidyltransferase